MISEKTVKSDILISEKSLEAKLRKEIKKLKGLCIKFTSPGMAGVPDRIILLPWRRIYFVEVKKPKGGVISAVQKVVHELFKKLGFPVTMIFNEKDLENFINEISL